MRKRWAHLLLASVLACAPGSRPDSRYGEAVVAVRDVPYARESARQRMDFFVPADRPLPPPLLVFVHGGGWMTLAKDDVALSLAPYLATGWAVANVEYRLGFEATAPAAARDVRCAVKFAAREAARYGADASRLVLVGESAGAHLVLLAAFADSTAGLDVGCPGPMPRVAGVIDWAGPTDVKDLLAGENQRGWATGWIGTADGAAARADAMSPLRWVRSGLPRVLIIHGDADQTVPYSHSARLARALNAAGVPNVLVTLAGEDHGPYAPAPAAKAWATVLGWLADVGGAGVH